MEPINLSAWTDEDVAKLVGFLNMVATHATLDMKVADIIKFYGLLSWCQNGLKTKIEDHIFKINKVTPAPEQEPKKSRKKGE